MGLAGWTAWLSCHCLALGPLVLLWSSLVSVGSGGKDFGLQIRVWRLEFGVPSLPQSGSGTPAHLLPVAHMDASLDVGEGMVRAQQCLALVLFVQLPVCTPIGCKGRAEQKGAQPVVAVEIGHPVLELIGIEVRFHICDLDVSLGQELRCEAPTAPTYPPQGLQDSQWDPNPGERGLGPPWIWGLCIWGFQVSLHLSVWEFPEVKDFGVPEGDKLWNFPEK